LLEKDRYPDLTKKQKVSRAKKALPITVKAGLKPPIKKQIPSS
jgi:hypothetical protein